MPSIFCDEKFVILLKFLPKAATVTLDCCVEMLGSLNACHHELHLARKISEMLLFADVHTTKAITEFWLTLLLHLPCNHDLTS
jgi:hypothetical protein